MESIRSYLSLVYIEIAAAANAMEQVEAEQHAAASAAWPADYLRLDNVLARRAARERDGSTTPSVPPAPERRPHTPRPSIRSTSASSGQPVPAVAAPKPRSLDEAWVPTSRRMSMDAAAIPQGPVPRVPAAATVPPPRPTPWPMVQV